MITRSTDAPGLDRTLSRIGSLCHVNLFPTLGIPTAMVSRFIPFATFSVCLLLASSCASTRSTRYAMRVQVAEDANARTPVPVDVVFVWDKALAGQLDSTMAKDWFAT